MDIRKLFDDWADIYARVRPRYPRRLYAWLAGLCPARRVVWDVGCGSGQAAGDLQDYFDFVEATDVSAAQIANAPPYERVRFSAQPAESTDFADNAFDAVCVAQALHWFDYDKFWPEVKRVLRPRGIFAAWGYSWPRIDQAIDNELEESLLSVIEPYWAPQNKALWDGYRDLSLPFDRLDAPDFELKMEWTAEEFFAYLHSWSAARRCLDEAGDAFFARSYERIHKLWGNGVKRTVAMDFVVIAGRHGV